MPIKKSSYNNKIDDVNALTVHKLLEFRLNDFLKPILYVMNGRRYSVTGV